MCEFIKFANFINIITNLTDYKDKYIIYTLNKLNLGLFDNLKIHNIFDNFTLKYQVLEFYVSNIVDFIKNFVGNEFNGVALLKILMIFVFVNYVIKFLFEIFSSILTILKIINKLFIGILITVYYFLIFIYKVITYPLRFIRFNNKCIVFDLLLQEVSTKIYLTKKIYIKDPNIINFLLDNKHHIFNSNVFFENNYDVIKIINSNAPLDNNYIIKDILHVFKS